MELLIKVRGGHKQCLKNYFSLKDDTPHGVSIQLLRQRFCRTWQLDSSAVMEC